MLAPDSPPAKAPDSPTSENSSSAPASPADLTKPPPVPRIHVVRPSSSSRAGAAAAAAVAGGAQPCAPGRKPGSSHGALSIILGRARPAAATKLQLPERQPILEFSPTPPTRARCRARRGSRGGFEPVGDQACALLTTVVLCKQAPAAGRRAPRPAGRRRRRRDHAPRAAARSAWTRLRRTRAKRPRRWPANTSST